MIAETFGPQNHLLHPMFNCVLGGGGGGGGGVDLAAAFSTVGAV